MKIGYFDTREFESRDGKESPYEHVVQGKLLALLNAIRSKFKLPIIVNSGYRSPEHNAAIGGAKNSFHVQGLAADIRPVDMNDLKLLRELALEMNPNGGVGWYDNFVHVDARGKRARWDERTKKDGGEIYEYEQNP